MDDNVIDLRERLKREPATEETETEIKPNPAEEARFSKSESYLTELDLSEALKVFKENPEGIVMPRELAKIEESRIMSVGTDAIKMLMLEEVQDYWERKTGETLSDQEKRALHNYIVLGDIGNFVIGNSGLTLRNKDASRSERVIKKEWEIKNKKLELIREFLGEGIVERTEGLEKKMDELWQDKEWQRVLAEAKDAIKPHPNLETPLQFLEKAAHLAGVVISDGSSPGVRNLATARRDKLEHKKIDEALAAYRQSMSEALDGRGDLRPWIIKKADNIYWNVAGERQMAIESDMANRRALKVLEILRRNMGLELMKQDLRSVEDD